MKKIKLFLFLCLFMSQNVLLNAQEKLLPQGISYQAIAQGTDGELLIEKPIKLRFSFTSKDGRSAIYYQEEQVTSTQADGSFQVVIGQGKASQGTLNEVPWATQNIYLGVELAEVSAAYKLVSRSQMLAVPYAFVAQQAGRITNEPELDERNQSRYWLTSGNNETKPPVHFLGTIDAKDLHFKTNGETRMKIDAAGRFQIINDPQKMRNGKDTEMEVYPLYVEAQSQGIWIEIEEDRSSNNNYLTFEDSEGVQGRVEGQTLDEAQNEDLYKLQVALYALKTTSLALQIVGEAISAPGYAGSVFGAGVSVGAIVNGIIWAAEIGIFVGDAASWAANIANDIGVAYQSGAGDYAEYILRDTLSREILPGEVVGVYAGQVSLKTQNAEYLSVVSTAPAVIGGMPQPGEESKYEKVAFIGQVPVRVTGAVNIGDYILPSGNNDGLAIAVPPYQMKAGDYSQIIGVAWESAPENLLNMIKVAVGINANDIGTEIATLNLKVNKIYDYLEGKGTLSNIKETDQGSLNTMEEGITQMNKILTDEEFDQTLEEHRESIEKIFKISQKYLEATNQEMTHRPEMETLFDDPISFLQELRRDPAFYTQWSVVDRQIMENINR